MFNILKRIIRNIPGCLAAACLLSVSAWAGTITFNYDPSGRLSKAAYSPEKALFYTFNAAGNLVETRAGLADSDQETDSNGDGIPDRWYVQYGLDPRDPNIANVDSNGNGYTNRQEYLLGTDPTNPATTFRLMQNPAVNSQGATIQWSAVAGKTYRLEYKNSLSDAQWQAVPGDVTATGAAAFKVDNTGTGQRTRYYRISLVLP